MKRLPLVASFLLFIALCASIAYWALQLFKPPLRPVAAPPRAVQAEVRPEAASALFGARGGNVAVASNYQLQGVIFAGTARNSVAILSTDGKPAQAVRVNKEVLPGVTVKEVHREYVLLSEGGVTKRVELPESAKGQVGLVTARAPAPAQSTPAAGQGLAQRPPPMPPASPAAGQGPPQRPPPIPPTSPTASAALPPASIQPPQAGAALPPPPGMPVPSVPNQVPAPAAMSAPPTIVTSPQSTTPYTSPQTFPPPVPPVVPTAPPATSVIPSTLPPDPATAPLQSR